MKIKVLEKTKGCMPETFKVGDWIDVVTAEETVLKCPYAKALHKKKVSDDTTERFRDVQFHYTILKLGVCIEVPKGYECLLVPRSSTFKKWGILQTNSVGIIDQSYCSDKDEWGLPVMATRNVTIPKGVRIAQFRVQLSQKATVWQKIKWLFTKSIKIKHVDTLSNAERGGFGKGTDNVNSNEYVKKADK